MVFFDTITFFQWLMLCAGVYLATSIAMCAIGWLALKDWAQSRRSKKASLLLRWHPGCPDTLAVRGYASYPPDADDKRTVYALAFLPIFNTCTLAYYIVGLPVLLADSAWRMARKNRLFA